jgi:F-type H+-transporting ATPase subunit b
VGAEFWVAVGFFILVGLFIYMGVPRMIAASLDQYSEKIRADLDEATRLRREAAALRDEYVRKRQDAEKEARRIVDEARQEAAEMKESMEAKLAEYIKRRTEAVEMRIAQEEKQAVEDVRTAAVDSAAKIAEQVLRKEFAAPDLAAGYLGNEIGNLPAGFQ